MDYDHGEAIALTEAGMA